MCKLKAHGLTSCQETRANRPTQKAGREKSQSAGAWKNFSVLSGFALSDLLSSGKNTEDSTEGVINHGWIPTVVLPGESR